MISIFDLSQSELRNIQFDDLHQVLAWRNSARVRKSMFTNQLISWDEHVAWFDQLQQRSDQEVLVFSYAGIRQGVVSFSRIDRDNRCCEWGFYIGSVEGEPGRGTVMGTLGLDYAFDVLAMDSVYGQCFITNDASVRYHEKMGFTYKHRLEISSASQGTNHCVKVFELTKKAWIVRREVLFPQVFGMKD